MCSWKRRGVEQEGQEWMEESVSAKMVEGPDQVLRRVGTEDTP